jgi:threonine synthase
VGRQPPRPASLKGIESLPRRFTLMPADVAQVKDYIVRHTAE